MNSKCETCMWMRHSPVGHVCARGFTLEVMLECDCKAYNTPRDSNQLELEERIEDLETQLGWYEEEIETLRNFCRRVDQKLNAIFGKQATSNFTHTGSNFCGNCVHHCGDCNIPSCELTGEICDFDDASCAMYEDAVDYKSNQLDGKPDRKECNHCDKPECSGCSNYPF